MVHDGHGMGEPEWDRYLVKPAAGAPLGDPTRWGSQTETIIPAGGLVDSVQVLQAATRDAYARSWSLLGTLSLTAELFNAAGGQIIISLDIAMGVGQAVVTHRISLFENDLPAGALGGLCYSQYVLQQGPYLAINAPPRQTRAFAIVGGLVGQSINIRCNYNVAAGIYTLPATALLALALAPYAAGDGL